ncbi:MAG TPA: NUDIX hydrolase, partial [Anaerolineae bacterium]|nr:NUDIX hydrolase [Anaerolineae bacterium]
VEESGIEVNAERLVGVYDANRVESALPLFHAYKLVFLCKRIGGELRSSEETLEARFFPLDELPSRLSAFRTTPRHIIDAIEARGAPGCETKFD